MSSFKLAEEILNSSDLHDTKRLAELIAQVKSRLQVNLSSSGHTVAAMRALSYESVYAFYNDATIGIAYNQMIRRLDEQMKENPQAVAEKLQQLIEKVFVRKRMLVSFTGEEGSYEKASPIMQKYLEKLPEGTPAQAAIHPVLSKKNEGFTDASQIQYVARSGNFISHGYAYHGTLKILKMILRCIRGICVSVADKVTGSCHILDLGGVRKSLIFLRKHRMDCSLRRCSFRKFLQILLHDRGSFFIRAFFSGKADEHSLSDKYFFYQLLQFFGYRLRILFHLFIQSADHLIVCNPIVASL